MRSVYTGRPVTESKKNADTDFGYERVPWNEKQRRVRGVFDSVADRYDVILFDAREERIRKDIADAEASLQKAGTSIQESNYSASQERLADSARKLEAAIAEIENATKGRARRK